jgi:hypothetical protein
VYAFRSADGEPLLSSYHLTDENIETKTHFVVPSLDCFCDTNAIIEQRIRVLLNTFNGLDSTVEVSKALGKLMRRKPPDPYGTFVVFRSVTN